MLDIIFAILIILACIKGYRRGLIVALFSIIAFIIGIAAALKFSLLVAHWLSQQSGLSAGWLSFLSFLLVFLGVVLLVKLGSKLIQKIFTIALLGWANKLGGMIFYAILYTLIFSVFLFFAQKINLLKPSIIASSQTYNWVQPWGPFVMDNFGKIIPIFKDMFAGLETFFNSISNKVQQ